MSRVPPVTICRERVCDADSSPGAASAAAVGVCVDGRPTAAREVTPFAGRHSQPTPFHTPLPAGRSPQPVLSAAANRPTDSECRRKTTQSPRRTAVSICMYCNLCQYQQLIGTVVTHRAGSPTDRYCSNTQSPTERLQ